MHHKISLSPFDFFDLSFRSSITAAIINVIITINIINPLNRSRSEGGRLFLRSFNCKVYGYALAAIVFIIACSSRFNCPEIRYLRFKYIGENTGCGWLYA